MNSMEVAAMKLNVILKLIQDQELAQLLDNNHEFEYPDDMIYERIFPFGRIPETEQEVKTYVTVMVSVPSIRSNSIARNVRMTVCAITHRDLMRVKNKNGTRIDLIGARIDTLLNEKEDFGMGKVALVSNMEHVMDSKHFYRELIFEVVDLNSRRYGT